mgnify:CR=1 FL=1
MAGTDITAVAAFDAVEQTELLQPPRVIGAGLTVQLLWQQAARANAGTGPAADTDIHEHLQGSIFIQPLLETFMDDLLPILRQRRIWFYAEIQSP